MYLEFTDIYSPIKIVVEYLHRRRLKFTRRLLRYRNHHRRVGLANHVTFFSFPLKFMAVIVIIVRSCATDK